MTILTSATLEMPIEDELSSLCADLVSEPASEAVLAALFGHPAGVWVAAHALSSGWMLDRVRAVDEAAGGELLMAWLDHPSSAYGAGYCTIVFFTESLTWSTLAVYNRGRLKQSGAA